MIQLTFLAIFIGFLWGIIVLSYRATLFLYYFISWRISKYFGYIKKLPTFFQIRDWFYIRKYKKEELPDLIWKTRQGDKEALAKRLKNAKNVNFNEKYGEDKGKYL